MLWGSHPIKMWSRTQALVSLSSAEAELYAAIKACSETLGFLTLLKDYQIHASGKVMSDANAALGIIKRQGLGRTRHIHTSYLWIQQVNERGINFGKVPGSENCADLFTKPLTRESAEHLSELVGMEFPEGHDEIALLRQLARGNRFPSKSPGHKPIYALVHLCDFHPSEVLNTSDLFHMKRCHLFQVLIQELTV